MLVSNLGEIRAVAFDIDGTLYKEAHLYRKMIPHFFANIFFFMEYGLARKDLRRDNPDTAQKGFAQVQAEYMAKRLHCTPEKAMQRLDKIVYSGLVKYFPDIQLYSGVSHALHSFKQAGLKMALLSDFPPEQKGDLWGLKELFDVSLGTEQAGALKPDSKGFLTLAERLGIPANQILYVGNSYNYDVIGAKNAGMKTAWFASEKKIKSRKDCCADFVFSNYEDLEKFILGDSVQVVS